MQMMNEDVWIAIVVACIAWFAGRSEGWKKGFKDGWNSPAWDGCRKP